MFMVANMLTDSPSAAQQQQSQITFSDGSAPVILDLFAMTEGENPQSVSLYPWWLKDTEPSVQAYHTKVRLDNGEALLVDTGAPRNMAGDRVIKRISDHAAQHGQGCTTLPLKNSLSVEGVGSGASSCTHESTVAIALADGQIAHYRAPVVQESELPALLGLESMEKRRAILDLVHGKLIELGPGPFKLELPPGSRVLQMQKSPTGHLMLPCSEWQDKKTAKPSGKVYVETVM